MTFGNLPMRRTIPLAATFARLLPAALLAGSAMPAHAQYAVSDSGDTSWLLVSAIVTLIAAIPGMALFVAGKVRPGQAGPYAAQVLGIVAGVSTIFAVIGYSLAFAAGDGWLGGAGNLMLGNLGELREGLTVPESAFVLMQMSAALLAAVILSGALAERVRFGWLMLFAPLWSLVAYAPLARWLWNNGLLAAQGAADLSGGLVIAVSAGTSGLVAAALLGRRDEQGAGTPVLSLAGAGMIWIGWLALTGGLSASATDGTAAAIINAHLSAATGVIGWGVAQRILGGQLRTTQLASGALAGLAASGVSAALVGPGGALTIGLFGGAIAFLLHLLVERRLGIDDVGGVGPIFLGGGATGALLSVPFTATTLGGVGLAEGASAAGFAKAQVIALAATIGWSGIVTAILALGISLVMPLRAAQPSEPQG